MNRNSANCICPDSLYVVVKEHDQNLPPELFEPGRAASEKFILTPWPARASLRLVTAPRIAPPSRFSPEDGLWRAASPWFRCARKLVGVTGVEPVTLRLSSACSNQLSYTPAVALRAKAGRPTQVRQPKPIPSLSPSQSARLQPSAAALRAKAGRPMLACQPQLAKCSAGPTFAR